ncbi:MAG: hypothetical protein ACTSU5_18170 [Promethearchaeota archaeon]
MGADVQAAFNSTAYFEKSSGLLLYEVCDLDEQKTDDPGVWFSSTFTKLLVDVDYVGEDPDEDSADTGGTEPPAYNMFEDPMFRVAVGVALLTAGGVVVAVVLIRRRAEKDVVRHLKAPVGEDPAKVEREFT